MFVKIKQWKMKADRYIAHNGFYLLLAFVLLGLSILLVDVERYDLLPATFFSVITLHFSYLAYQFSQDKFRLDLFDKRWEVYKNTLEYCSIVTQQGRLVMTEDNKDQIANALRAADNSFRGIGWHKTRFLFGVEIYLLFKKLNESYAWLASYSERPSDPKESAEWPKKMYDNSMFIWNTVQTLPDVFKPYIYFGDYKSVKWSINTPDKSQ